MNVQLLWCKLPQLLFLGQCWASGLTVVYRTEFLMFLWHLWLKMPVVGGQMEGSSRI